MEPTTPRGPICFGAPCTLLEWRSYMLQDYETLSHGQKCFVGRIRRTAKLAQLRRYFIKPASRQPDPGYLDPIITEVKPANGQEHAHSKGKESATMNTSSPALYPLFSKTGTHRPSTEYHSANGDGNATFTEMFATLAARDRVARVLQHDASQSISSGLTDATGDSMRTSEITGQKRKTSYTVDYPAKKDSTKDIKQTTDESESATTPEESSNTSSALSMRYIKTEGCSHEVASQKSSSFTETDPHCRVTPGVLVVDEVQIYMDGSGGKFRVKGDWAIYFQGALTGQRFRLEGDSMHGYVFHTGKRWIDVPEK